MTGSLDVACRPDPRTAPGHDIEVLEKNTDTTWAMFIALSNQQDCGLGKTEPASVQPAEPAARPASPDVDAVMQEARRNNRVCPKPVIWQRLYDWLPNKGPQLAPVPASRAEWDRMSALDKRSRLREHIEWAAAHGVLHKVHEALGKLAEDRWHHMGE